MVYGPIPFTEQPKWHIHGTQLKVTDGITYLGAGLCKDGGTLHTEDRIKSAKKAFYALQNVGLHYKGLSPDVAAHIFTVGIQSTLVYGCDAININRTNLKSITTAHNNLLKATLGLRRSCHSTPIQKALDVHSPAVIIGLQSMNLLCSNMMNTSDTARFYCHLLGSKDRNNTLVHRACEFASRHNISTVRYILDKDYQQATKLKLKPKTQPGVDGVIDSVKSLLVTGTYNDHARDLIHQLIGATEITSRTM
jgi:hypothetical protein